MMNTPHPMRFRCRLGLHRPVAVHREECPDFSFEHQRCRDCQKERIVSNVRMSLSLGPPIACGVAVGIYAAFYELGTQRELTKEWR